MNFEISIGKGIGLLQFGISKSEANKFVGEPDKIVEEDGSLSEIYYDHQLLLQYEEDDKRLGWIVCRNPKTILFGETLIGMEKNKVLTVLKSKGYEPNEIDDHGTFESVSFDNIELELQFEFNLLNSINFGVFFKQDGSRNW